jgi:hypothetical protein
MVVQDALTGYVHEAPEFGYAEAPQAYGEVAYDGFGNPVGLIIPGLLRRIFGRGRQAPPPPPPPPPPDYPPPEMQPGVGEFPFPMIRPPSISFTPPRLIWSPSLGRFIRSIFSPTQNRWIPAPATPGALPSRRPWPLGWQRPSLPYTGLGPNRLYMRCAVWPGPKGLVPAIAATMMPGAGGPGGRRRRRRRR